jgi:hypothetical protein
MAAAGATSPEARLVLGAACLTQVSPRPSAASPETHHSDLFRHLPGTSGRLPGARGSGGPTGLCLALSSIGVECTSLPWVHPESSQPPQPLAASLTLRHPQSRL